MEIVTKAYGQIAIDPANIITFENGMIGFENLHKYVLLGKDESELLLWLQSAEDPEMAFVVIQPRFFKADYQPKIHVNELAELSVEDAADLLLYAVVVVPEDITKMTANLQAPIVINTKNNKGKQLILNDDTYKIKEPVFVAG